jgi:hypothetical protein
MLLKLVKPEQNQSTCKGFGRFVELWSTTTTTQNIQEAPVDI